MKLILATLFLLSIYFGSVGQSKSAIDSLTTTASTKLPDSLTKKELSRMNLAYKEINFKIDSLKTRGLPTSQYQKKLDSINQRMKNFLALKDISNKANKEIGSLKSKINTPQDSIKKKLSRRETRLKNSLNKKTSSIDSLSSEAKNKTSQFNLPSSQGNQNLPNKNIPNIGVPSNSVNSPSINNLSIETNELSKLNKDLRLPQSQEINQLKGEGKSIENLPKQELNSIGIAKEENEIKKDTKEVNTIEKKAGGYKDDIKKVKEGDSSKVASLQKDAEKAAQNTSEYKELSKETKVIQSPKNVLQQYQDMVGDLKKQNPLSGVKDFSTKEIKNPFIGQETKLQAGITQLDALKKKYKTIPDSRYLPKYVPNEMKGKPFKERLIPGVAFQTYQGANIGLDISAYLMYRVSGRLRAGLGASDRLLVDTKNRQVSSGHIYEARAMADIRLIPNLNFHVEEEWTYYGAGAESPYQKPTDPPMINWKVKFNMGLLKTYKISKRFDGQVQLLYNTLDWSNFPQGKNTTMRFGFEYKLGIKKKQS